MQLKFFSGLSIDALLSSLPGKVSGLLVDDFEWTSNRRFHLLADSVVHPVYLRMLKETIILNAPGYENASHAIPPAIGLAKLTPDQSSICRPIIMAFLLSMVAFVLSIVLLTPTFETNDDVVFSLLASGLAFGRSADSHICFSHFFVGSILSSLYSASQHVPWYGLYLTACNFLSTTVIFFCFFWRMHLKPAIALCLIAFVLALMHIVVFLQFTTSASLLCIASLFLLIRLSECVSPQKFGYCLVAALMTLSACIRFESCEQFCAVGILLLLCRNFSSLKRKVTALSVVALGLLAAIALHQLNSSFYERDEGWSQFQAFTKASWPFSNCGYLKPVLEDSPSIKVANWTAVDGQMIANWNLLDRENFSAKNFAEVLESCNRHGDLSPLMKLRELRKIFTDEAVLPMSIVCILALALTSRADRFRFSVFLLGNFGLLAVLSVMLKVASRVYFPVFCLATIVALWDLARCRGWLAAADAASSALENGKVVEKSKSISGAGLKLIAGGVLSALFLIGSGIWIDHVFLRPERNVWRIHKQLIEAIDSLHPERTDFYVAWKYPYEGILPFDDLTNYFSKMIICPMGTLSQSPVVTDISRLFAIDKIWMELDNPHMLFISTDDCNDFLISYMRQHYGTDFKYEKAGLFGPAQVWRWKRGKMQTSGGTWNCHSNEANHILNLYPSKEQSWTLTGLAPELKKSRSLFAALSSICLPSAGELPLDFDSFQMPWCSHCGIKSDEGSRFISAERLPTLSHFGALEIDPRQFPNFFIDLAVSDKITANRQVLVELNLNSAHPTKFFIPLQQDSKMHHYEYALKNLGLAKDELISELNVHPVYMREPGEKSSFTLKKLGFLHNESDSP